MSQPVEDGVPEDAGPRWWHMVVASAVGSAIGATIAEVFLGLTVTWWEVLFQPAVMFVLMGMFHLGERSRG